jgi:hypothetical protein
MKQTLLRMVAVAGVVYATTNVVRAQQVPLPTTAAEVRGPAPGVSSGGYSN